MPDVRGVLLDIDGTLLDSNEAHAQSWVEALAHHGIERPVDLVGRLIGMGADQLLPALGIDADSKLGKALGEEATTLFMRDHLPHLEPFPRAREFLLRLRADALRLVVATSAGKKELGPLLEQAGIADLLQEATSSDDAQVSKPAPDIVEAAVKRAETPRHALILLGDTPYDVKASARAGVRMVGVRSGGWADADLAGAIAVYEDVGHILSSYGSSPFARPGSSDSTP
jgi:phosphoglycolate phosphatase-like HAD superfamily hydrolase